MSSTNNFDQHGAKQFKPNVTVAAVVHCQGKYLCVEEHINGQRLFNQPAGHLEQGESIEQAMIRELQEETGLILAPDYLCGIYYWHQPQINRYFLRFTYVFELTSLPSTQAQDDEIIATHWLSYHQIQALAPQLRSPLVLRCLEHYQQGINIPLDAIKNYL